MVSIITVNYNNAQGLLKTVTSVVNQTYKNFEYIVIDGGSNDSSLEVINQNAHKISAWISEKDNGVYHAMNKGISMAKRDYILFLNSGDYFLNHTILQDVFSTYNMDKDIMYGDLILESEGRVLREKQYPDRLTFKFFYNGDSLPHPASFIKKSLFQRIGMYSEDFRIVSDWEFWLKAIFLFQASYARLAIPITVFNLEGASSKPENASIVSEEKNKVYQKYFSGFIDDYKSFEEAHLRIRDSRVIQLLNRLKLLKLC